MDLDTWLLNYFLLNKTGKNNQPTNQTKPIHTTKKKGGGVYFFTQWHLIFKNFLFAEKVILVGVLHPESKN